MVYGYHAFEPLVPMDKTKKSGLFGEVRCFQRVRDGGVGEVVILLGLAIESSQQRTYDSGQWSVVGDWRAEPMGIA
jgi:hypothetical protein